MSNSNEGYITHIRDVPVCNQRLYKEVGQLLNMDQKTVKEITDFVGEFVATTIKEGSMESVRIPYFGLFTPKPEKILRIQRARGERASGMSKLKRAVLGLPIDPTPKPTTDGR